MEQRKIEIKNVRSFPPLILTKATDPQAKTSVTPRLLRLRLTLRPDTCPMKFVGWPAFPGGPVGWVTEVGINDPAH